MENTQKPLIIYHDPCDDGFGAALAAWLKFGDEAEYCGRAHNMPIESLPTVIGRDVYILDFSFTKDVMRRIFEQAEKVVWLDHHKSSFDMWCGEDYLSIRPLFIQNEHVINECNNAVDCVIVLDNDKSGAILAWEYFHDHAPRLIRFIDDNDRWQFKFDGTKAFMRHLRALPMTFPVWSALALDLTEDDFCETFIKAGKVLEQFFARQVQDVLVSTKRPVEILLWIDEGNASLIMRISYKGQSANASSIFSSEIGHLLATDSGTFGLTWDQGKNGSVRCSLRSNGDYDVSVIAKRFGGGGHKNAAGFSTDMATLQSWLQ